MTYFSTEAIRAASLAAGHHWFDPKTLRFFSSRILRRVYGGRFFVTSERGSHFGRFYTVREVFGNAQIRNASVFQGFNTAEQAKACAARLARETR